MDKNRLEGLASVNQLRLEEKEEDIIPLFESQLKLCGVEYFDFYLFHCLTRETYPKHKACNSFEIVKKLKEQGKIKHIAMSVHDTADYLDLILTEQPFIEACRVYGFSGGHIAIRHILPNLWEILLSRFLIGVNGCIMMESTLSFLGFGDLYHPTWGTMINFAYRRGAFLRQAYPYLLTPGVCIMLLSLAFYLISLYVTSERNRVQK